MPGIGARTPHWQSDLRFIATGMLVCLLLVGVKEVIEASPVGHWFEKQTYKILIDRLPDFNKDGPDVVILDIKHLPGGEDFASGEKKPTSRKELLALVEALVESEPLAIGLDIDFAPNRDGWIDDNDPAFFTRCLALRRLVPIRLGIFRTMREPKGAWLGAIAYAPLAAGLWLPKADARRLPIWSSVVGRNERLPSLGASLVDDVKQIRPHWSDWFKLNVSERVQSFASGTPSLLVSEALVNYSLLEQMSRESIKAATPEAIRRNRESIQGRIVLVGDVERRTRSDLFVVPGRDDNSLACFSMHRWPILSSTIPFTSFARACVWFWILS